MPAVVVTVMLLDPADPAGEVTVIEVGDTSVTFVAEVVPNLAVAPLMKLVPAMVTVVPPAMGPAIGVTPVIVGID